MVSNALGQRDCFLISDFISQCHRVRQSHCKGDTLAESMGELKRTDFGDSTHVCVQSECVVGQGIIPLVVLHYGGMATAARNASSTC
jgi:hypothetical protein